MLIIEGCDGVGKTTLARRLVSALAGSGHVYAHFSRLPDGFDRFHGYRERAGRRVVQDRFHMSEVVYAGPRGDRTPLCPETYRLVDAELRRLGALTVLVLADDALVADRWHGDQMYGLNTTLETNRLYSGLPGSFPDYRMDVDVVVECSGGHPFPDDADVDRVLAAYSHRQAVLDVVLDRRRPQL